MPPDKFRNSYYRDKKVWWLFYLYNYLSIWEFYICMEDFCFGKRFRAVSIVLISPKLVLQNVLTSRQTVPHPQRPPLPTLYKISLPFYVIMTNKHLQPLTTTRYNSLGLSFSLLKIYQRLIKHRSFLCTLHRGCRSTSSSNSNTLLPHIHDKACIEVYTIKCHTHTKT